MSPIKNNGELVSESILDDFSKNVYVIDGKPVPLQRARHGNRRTWDAQKILKHSIGLVIASQHRAFPIWSIPLTMHITFYMAIPKVKKGKLEGRPHYSRPDLSNVLKFVEDICTGIIYADDSLIYCCHAQKIYDGNPRTEFSFTPWRDL